MKSVVGDSLMEIENDTVGGWTRTREEGRTKTVTERKFFVDFFI